MELTEDLLRRIADTIADAYTQISAVQMILGRLGRDPQELTDLIEEVRKSPHYQMICDEIFEKLKGRSVKDSH
jgi:hypothetical protein